jgi:hypothetical protein
MDKDTCQLQSCHVPDPDSAWHLVTFRGHIVGSIAPFNLLYSSWWSRNTYLLKFGMLESISLLFGHLRDLDYLLFRLRLVQLLEVLVADILM